MTVIKKVDMFKNHLRLVVANGQDSDKYILLTPMEAHELVKNILEEVDTHGQYLKSDYGDKLWERTIAYNPKGKAIHDT